MSGVSLYDRVQEMDDALEAFEAAESEEEREVALEKLNSVSGELLQKVDRFASYLSSLENVENWAAEELKRLEKRAKRAKSRRLHLEAYALSVMAARGWEEMAGETSTLKARRNPASVVVTSENDIPPEFLEARQSVVVDKTKIKVAIRAGREVPGARLESRMSLRRE